MNVIAYRMTLLEPLLATRLEGDPNSSVSFPYVPGSQLRGAVVAALLASPEHQALDAGDEEARRLFFDGRTRYLNAYPLAAGNVRTLPTPLSWFAPKGQDAPLFDFAVKTRFQLDGRPTQFQAVAGEHPFCQIQAGEVSYWKPGRQVNVHTSRDRRKGRALDKSGAVFQYDALAAGEQFGGLVLAETDTDGELLAGLLQQVTILGRSGNSGYGRVEIEVDPDWSKESWREVGGSIAGIPAEVPFLVTLLSDTIVRDPQTGQHSADLVPTLQELLQVELSYAAVGDPEQRGTRRVQEVGAFNRTWGLPLTQAHALTAGSVFVLVSNRPLAPSALQKLEWQGVGERRAEGFGRLAFQWQTRPELKLGEAGLKPTLQEAPDLNGTAQSLAQHMVERMLRRDLDAALQARINALHVAPCPSNAQLGRFRVIARDALATNDLGRLLAFLTDIDERRSARDQFQRSRINGKRLDRWLGERLSSPESIWSELKKEGASRRLGGNVSCNVKDDLALAQEYTIRLVDGVLAKAARESREQED